MPVKRDIKNIKDIRKIFDDFYSYLLPEAIMKPYFKHFDNQKIEEHKHQIVQFWNGILFQEEGYEGDPIATHKYIHHLKRMSDQAFEHWLSSFDRAIDKNFIGPNANLAKEKSRIFASIFKETLSKT